jgi:hypothetical protein
MKIQLVQIYIEPGVAFSFSHHFQRRMGAEITSLVEPSSSFVKDYAHDYKLVFNMSAKNAIDDNEIRGPTVFRKTKDVEYSIFLPFDLITKATDVPRAALRYLLKGICAVLDSLNIDTAKIVKQQDALVEEICNDPIMFHVDDEN